MPCSPCLRAASGVCCQSHSGLALWLLGYPTAALERCREAFAVARDTIVNASHFSAIVDQLRGHVEAVRHLAESIISLSIEHGFQQWLAFGKVLDSWVLTEQGRSDTAIARFRGEISEYRASGTELNVPHLLALLATAHLKHGTAGEGLAVVGDALDWADATGTHLWDSELHRLKGELLLALDPSTLPSAKIAFGKAIDIARRQSAKSWELSAATSLARLWRDQGKRQQAHDLLAPVYGWFTEGFDTPVLQDGKALLDQLT